MPFFSKTFLGPWGAAINSSKSTRDKLYGTKPIYSTPEKAAAESTAANLANLPKAEELGAKVNMFNQDQIMAMLRRVIPGFDKRNELSSDVLTARLKGEFTESELDELQLAAAARGVGRGTGGGSPFDKADLARSLGLNRYQETQRALDSNARWTESMAKLTQPALFNVGSAFITPQQQFDYNKLVAEAEAAPNSGVRGEADMQNAIMGMTLGVYGGAGYQNAYRPASQAPTQYYQQNAGANSIPGGSYYDGSQAWSGKYGETAGAGAFNF